MPTDEERLIQQREKLGERFRGAIDKSGLGAAPPPPPKPNPEADAGAPVSGWRKALENAGRAIKGQ
jgi:hypothetical protein